MVVALDSGADRFCGIGGRRGNRGSFRATALREHPIPHVHACGVRSTYGRPTCNVSVPDDLCARSLLEELPDDLLVAGALTLEGVLQAIDFVALASRTLLFQLGGLVR